VTVLEYGVDTDVIVFICERRELALAEAEAPILTVVRRPVRDPIRMIGKREQMLPQFGHLKPGANRNAVADDMKVGSLEVDHSFAALVLDECVADVPLLWHRPIQYYGPGGDLVNVKRNTLRHTPERLPNAVSSDAPANGEELSDERVHVVAEPVGLGGSDWSFHVVHCSFEDD
jgi:hypothetical protein